MRQLADLAFLMQALSHLHTIQSTNQVSSHEQSKAWKKSCALDILLVACSHVLPLLCTLLCNPLSDPMCTPLCLNGFFSITRVLSSSYNEKPIKVILFEFLPCDVCLLCKCCTLPLSAWRTYASVFLLRLIMQHHSYQACRLSMRVTLVGCAATPSVQQRCMHSACKVQIQQRLKLAVASLQDYETAQSTLKLLASDYKSDKAYKHLAGVQVSFLPKTPPPFPFSPQLDPFLRPGRHWPGQGLP